MGKQKEVGEFREEEALKTKKKIYLVFFFFFPYRKTTKTMSFW
jgi:hypothetical protein